jgi:signal transduction histidine kinase
MKKRTDKNREGFTPIPFRIHPRVFAALGADLVTNDVVAVIELVKNSYDAFAQDVWIRFRDDPSLGVFLEIEDNGGGMTWDIIKETWCLVATPFKELSPVVTQGDKKRRVAGEKGLGRLSAARLGNRLHMLTQAPGSPCWEVEVDWAAISEKEDLSKSIVECRQYPEESPFRISGTRIRIFDLKGPWDDNHISDLEDNLARLITPFSDLGEFKITLSGFDTHDVEAVAIESPEFLSKPKYCIKGEVDEGGNVEGTYRFLSIPGRRHRTRKVRLSWEQVYDLIQDRTQFTYSPDSSHCGSFSFEIRAWDISGDDTEEIAEHFNLQKSHVRKAIRAHKGISIYRDGILVLPKSDSARDWLGLDLRRVSKVGTRLSTSQVVGYVSISAEKNPKIRDTSDRERLASCIEVAEFEEILKAVIALLENERDEDRTKPDRERPVDSLFEGLSAESLLADMANLSEEGGDLAEAIPLIRDFSTSLDSARKTIEERFVYYSRLATVGTIAHMLVHEIRNRTTAFGSFLEVAETRLGPFRQNEVSEAFRSADSAVDALERLADVFAPLASRSFKRGRRQSVLERQIMDCLALNRGEMEKKQILSQMPSSETLVAVDPGELDAILLNLISNAIYWLGEVPKDDRKLVFDVVPDHQNQRVRVWVRDTGPGISSEYVEKVFWPGVTKKPGGIGMGLTVAAELVAAYGGHMFVERRGKMKGATFAFDLPLVVKSGKGA